MFRTAIPVLSLLVALSVSAPAFAKPICGLVGPTGWAVLEIKPKCKQQKPGKLKVSSVHGAYNNPVNGCKSNLTGTCIGDENGVRLSFSSASSTCDDFLVEVSGDDLSEMLLGRFERLQTSDHPAGTSLPIDFQSQDCKVVPLPISTLSVGDGAGESP